MSTNSRGIGSMSDRARTMNTEPSFLENERQLAADFARGVYDVGRAGFSGLTHQVVGGYGGIIEALIQQGDYDKAEWLINEIQQQAYLPEEGTAGAEALETIGKVFEPVEKHLIKKPGDFLAEHVSPGAGAAYQGGMTSFLEFLPFHLRSRAGPGIGQVAPAAFLERPASKSGPTTAMGGPEIGQFVESRPSDTVPVRPEDIQYQTLVDDISVRYGDDLPVVAESMVDPTVTERVGTAAPALTSVPEERITQEELPPKELPLEELPSEELRAQSISRGQKPPAAPLAKLKRVLLSAPTKNIPDILNPNNGHFAFKRKTDRELMNLGFLDREETTFPFRPSIIEDIPPEKIRQFSDEILQLGRGEITDVSSEFKKYAPMLHYNYDFEFIPTRHLEKLRRRNPDINATINQRINYVQDSGKEIIARIGETMESSSGYKAGEELVPAAPLETVLKTNREKIKNITNVGKLPLASTFLQELTGNKAKFQARNIAALKKVPEIKSILEENKNKRVADFSTLSKDEKLSGNYLDINALIRKAQEKRTDLRVVHKPGTTKWADAQLPVELDVTEEILPKYKAHSVRVFSADTEALANPTDREHGFAQDAGEAVFDEEGNLVGGRGNSLGHQRVSFIPSRYFKEYGDYYGVPEFSAIPQGTTNVLTETQSNLFEYGGNPYAALGSPEKIKSQLKTTEENVKRSETALIELLPGVELEKQFKPGYLNQSESVQVKNLISKLANKNKGWNSDNYFHMVAHNEFDVDLLLIGQKLAREESPQESVSTLPSQETLDFITRFKEKYKINKNLMEIMQDARAVESENRNFNRKEAGRDPFMRTRLSGLELTPEQARTFLQDEFLGYYRRNDPKFLKDNKKVIKDITDAFLGLRDPATINLKEADRPEVLTGRIYDFLDTVTGLGFEKHHSRNFQPFKTEILDNNPEERPTLYGHSTDPLGFYSSATLASRDALTLFEKWLSGSKENRLKDSFGITPVWDGRNSYDILKDLSLKQQEFKNAREGFEKATTADKQYVLNDDFKNALTNRLAEIKNALNYADEMKRKGEEIIARDRQANPSVNISSTEQYREYRDYLKALGNRLNKDIIKNNPNVFLTPEKHKTLFNKVISEPPVTGMPDLIKLDSAFPSSVFLEEGVSLDTVKRELGFSARHLENQLNNIGSRYKINSNLKNIRTKLYGPDEEVTIAQEYTPLGDTQGIVSGTDFHKQSINYFITEGAKNPEVSSLYFPGWKNQVIAHGSPTFETKAARDKVSNPKLKENEVYGQWDPMVGWEDLGKTKKDLENKGITDFGGVVILTKKTNKSGKTTLTPKLSPQAVKFKNAYDKVVNNALKEFQKQYPEVTYKKIKVDPDVLENTKMQRFPETVPPEPSLKIEPVSGIYKDDIKNLFRGDSAPVEGILVDLSKLKNRKNFDLIKFVEPMKKGGEVKNFSRGTEVSNQNDRLYYDFMDRLGASAEGAKDVLASEALKLTQPEESAKGVSKAQIFDRLGALSDYGYLGYDVLRHLGGKKDAFSADPEKRPLSSDWMAKQAGMPYLEEESAGRILGGLASWNLAPAIRGSLGMVKKTPKDERQGDLFDDPTPKPSEQGIGSFQEREEFTDFSTQPSKLGNQSLFPNERKQGRKLLVLGCCKTKTKQDFDIPARERYIGQLFQVLNKYDLEKGLPDNVDIAVLSAKHGLIRLDTPLKDYDLRMEPKHRDAILGNEDQVGRINNTLEGYDDVFVAAGKDYTKVIDNVTGRESYKTYKDIDKKVEGIGDHKRILGNWLAAEKGRFEGAGSLQKTAKEMNVKKMPGSLAEKIEVIRETNKLQGSSESGSFSKRFAQDVLDLTRKVREHPLDTLDDFEKQAALMQQLKHKTSIQDLLSDVSDDAVREAVTDAIDSIVYSDRNTYKKLGTSRFFRPVNTEKVSDWVIVTKGENPRLKIKFQELTERTTSKEAEKPKPKFIDLDEMELSDYTPDAFAQGGGINSLNTVARAMNYR